MKKAVKIISDNRAAVDALVDRLLQKDHLTGEEIKAVFSAYNIIT
jgi:ATP-dependent Zn protease